MSIAKATGRQFVRLSLGGVRDEAEIPPPAHIYRRIAGQSADDEEGG